MYSQPTCKLHKPQQRPCYEASKLSSRDSAARNLFFAESIRFVARVIRAPCIALRTRFVFSRLYDLPSDDMSRITTSPMPPKSRYGFTAPMIGSVIVESSHDDEVSPRPIG